MTYNKVTLKVEARQKMVRNVDWASSCLASSAIVRQPGGAPGALLRGRGGKGGCYRCCCNEHISNLHYITSLCKPVQSIANIASALGPKNNLASHLELSSYYAIHHNRHKQYRGAQWDPIQCTEKGCSSRKFSAFGKQKLRQCLICSGVE